jgi:hypothetical protein
MIEDFMKWCGSLKKNVSIEPPLVGLDHQHSDHLLGVVRECRGDFPPVLMIHGIYQRSGTVYLGELLRLHPKIHAYPNDVWEIPLLQNIEGLLQMQSAFFQEYVQNKDRLDSAFLLPLLGASFLRYMHSFADPSKVLLLKQPSVRNLCFFNALFPDEKLVLLIRDGRDVVASVIRTWPEIPFETACNKWNEAALQIIQFQNMSEEFQPSHIVVKYEACVADPEGTTRKLLEFCGLDASVYPFEAIPDLPLRGSSKTFSKGHVSWEPKAKEDCFQLAGAWTEWGACQKRLFETIAGDSMRAFGYWAADEGMR